MTRNLLATVLQGRCGARGGWRGRAPARVVTDASSRSPCSGRSRGEAGRSGTPGAAGTGPRPSVEECGDRAQDTTSATRIGPPVSELRGRGDRASQDDESAPPNRKRGRSRTLSPPGVLDVEAVTPVSEAKQPARGGTSVFAHIVCARVRPSRWDGRGRWRSCLDVQGDRRTARWEYRRRLGTFRLVTDDKGTEAWPSALKPGRRAASPSARESGTVPALQPSQPCDGRAVHIRERLGAVLSGPRR
jgi:hypothetical protein